MDYDVAPLNKEDIDLADWEFEAQQRGEQPILLCDFFSRSLNEYFVYYVTGEKRPFGYLFTDSNKLNRNIEESDLYFGEFRRQLEDKRFLKQVLANAVDIPKAFNRDADADMAELALIADPDGQTLARYWQKLDEGFLKVIPWFWYPWYMAKEDVLTNKVRVGLEKYRPEIEKLADFDEALLSAIFPVKKTSFQLEQADMYELVTTGDQSAFERKADEYLKKYDWLTTFILTPVRPMTREQLMGRVERAKREKFAEVYPLQQKESEKKTALAVTVLDLVKSDAGLLDDIADARELGYGLTAGIEEAYMSTSKYLALLELVAQKIGVAFEDTKYLLSKEIHRALTRGEVVDLALIEERRKGFAMMMCGGKLYAAYGVPGHALSAWIDGELNKIDDSINEFKGQIACKGRAQGRARIALTPQDSHELLEGEILLCPMTNPDYVPAMKRAGAIVTDEGGLLSHAAIMSREFNKPCVIGTKIATKILKTGDLIEVDAEKGVIKKI